MQTPIPSQKVTTYYLKMTSVEELIENDSAKGLHVVETMVKQYAYNRFLYQYVGQYWDWVDKLEWSDERWKQYVEDDNLRTWVAYFQGSPVGYFELQKQTFGDVEIAYFGLAKEFIGRGFGSYLLTQAVRSAWSWRGTECVWVHTCTKDHPSALPNYLARGFRVFRKEESERIVSEFDLSFQ